jgi:hypothetical protein
MMRGRPVRRDLPYPATALANTAKRIPVIGRTRLRQNRQPLAELQQKNPQPMATATGRTARAPVQVAAMETLVVLTATALGMATAALVTETVTEIAGMGMAEKATT